MQVQELVFPLGVKGGAVVAGEAAEGEPVMQQSLSFCLWAKAALSTATARIISYFYKDFAIFVARMYGESCGDK